MTQARYSHNPDRECVCCQTESMLERALNAPPRFSRRRFLATSATASLAFTLASQPGRLSADGTATESSGSNGGNPNTQQTSEPWTVKLSAINPGDGANKGPDANAFNWKRLVGTTKGGMQYLLTVRWRLEPECFVNGVNKRQDSWQYRLNLLAQLRTGPITTPSPLPAGAEEYMVVDGLYYSNLLLDAGEEGGDMNYQVDKSTTHMKCVLTTANVVNDREEKTVNGKKLILILKATFTPVLGHEAGTLPVAATIAASVIETATNSLLSKWGIEFAATPFKVTFGGESPAPSDYTEVVSTSCTCTFQAVSGAPNYSCVLPPP